MTYQFDLNKPSHLIANDVLKRLEALTGANIVFGKQSHELIEGLVAQYQDKLLEAHKASRNNMLAETRQQAKEDDALETKLRDMFAAARFPAIEDVYVSTAHCAYVSFSAPLTLSQIQFASAALNLEIERSDPRLRNRYRVTFVAPDREEL